MRFLLVDQTLRNLSLLDHLEKEGNETAVLTSHELPNRTVFHTVSSALEWGPNTVIFLEAGMGKLAADLDKAGVNVFHGGVYHDTLTEDPDYASVLASRVKVPILPVDNGGVHLHLAGFFSKKGFVGPALSYAVETELLPGSSQTESVTIHAISDNSPIVRETYYKLEKLFTALKFCGMVFLDIQVDPDTKVPHIHKMTVEIPDGFLAAFIEGASIKPNTVGRLINGLSQGRKFNYTFTSEVAGTVKVSLPPYPHTELEGETDTEKEVITRLTQRLSSGRHLEVEESISPYWLNVDRTGDGYTTTGPEVAFISGTGSLQELPYILGTAIDGLRLNGTLQYKSSLGKELATSLAYFEDYGAYIPTSTEDSV